MAMLEMDSAGFSAGYTRWDTTTQAYEYYCVDSGLDPTNGAWYLLILSIEDLTGTYAYKIHVKVFEEDGDKIWDTSLSVLGGIGDESAKYGFDTQDKYGGFGVWQDNQDVEDCEYYLYYLNGSDMNSL